MAIQWVMPSDIAGGLSGGTYVNETSAGALEFALPNGSYVNEQPAAAAGAGAQPYLVGMVVNPGSLMSRF